MHDITFTRPDFVLVATISRGCFDFGSELGGPFDGLVTFVPALGTEVLAEDWADRQLYPVYGTGFQGWYFGIVGRLGFLLEVQGKGGVPLDLLGALPPFDRRDRVARPPVGLRPCHALK